MSQPGSDSSIDAQPSYHIANAHSLVWHASNEHQTEDSYDDDLALANTHAAIAQAMLLERQCAILAQQTLIQQSIADILAGMGGYPPLGTTDSRVAALGQLARDERDLLVEWSKP